MKLIFYSFEVLMSTIEPPNMKVIRPLVIEIEHSIVFVPTLSFQTQDLVINCIDYCNGLVENRRTLAWIYRTWSISITSGRMAFIFCSLVVLMSTSKPQNMSDQLLLIIEISYDIVWISQLHSLPNYGKYLVQIVSCTETGANCKLSVNWSPISRAGMTSVLF